MLAHLLEHLAESTAHVEPRFTPAAPHLTDDSIGADAEAAKRELQVASVEWSTKMCGACHAVRARGMFSGKQAKVKAEALGRDVARLLGVLVRRHDISPAPQADDS